MRFGRWLFRFSVCARDAQTGVAFQTLARPAAARPLAAATFSGSLPQEAVPSSRSAEPPRTSVAPAAVCWMLLPQSDCALTPSPIADTDFVAIHIPPSAIPKSLAPVPRSTDSAGHCFGRRCERAKLLSSGRACRRRAARCPVAAKSPQFRAAHTRYRPVMWPVTSSACCVGGRPPETG